MFLGRGGLSSDGRMVGGRLLVVRHVGCRDWDDRLTIFVDRGTLLLSIDLPVGQEMFARRGEAREGKARPGNATWGCGCRCLVYKPDTLGFISILGWLRWDGVRGCHITRDK
jgi:hypothetical protein